MWILRHITGLELAEPSWFEHCIQYVFKHFSDIPSLNQTIVIKVMIKQKCSSYSAALIALSLSSVSVFSFSLKLFRISTTSFSILPMSSLFSCHLSFRALLNQRKKNKGRFNFSSLQSKLFFPSRRGIITTTLFSQYVIVQYDLKKAVFVSSN